MERYTSFDELKKRTHSKTSKKIIATSNEDKLIDFINLLRSSVVSSAESTFKPSVNNAMRLK